MSLSDEPSRRPPSEDAARLDATRQVDALCDEYDSATRANELLPFGPYVDRIDRSLRGRLVEELAGIACERLRARGVADPVDRVRDLNADLPASLLAVIDEGTALFVPPTRPATPLTPAGKPSRGLRLRCPHCSNHVELVGDTPLDAVDCTTCGSRFSLVDRARETAMAATLKQVDRFELIARLGVGGFGTVWKARDTELDRAVAIKIPRRGQLSTNEIEQFLREARSAAQLSHPNIVPVHEVGREGDAVFIVSDLVRGVSLADLLTGKQPTTRESAELVATIADALEHAHRRGVVHRDLKPSNIMVDDAGTPHLMDFGLAKREAEEVTMTTEGQIIGTPAYMSPEQAGGRSAWADRRTDVYSLGVMLFQLLTGELPFRGNAQMQVHQRLTEDAPSARQLNRNVPQDLATICAKCLEREPGRRYQTAQEVREEIQRYIDKRPIRARPLSPIQKAARWSARNPSRAVACGLIATLAVVGPIVAVLVESQRSRLAALVEEKNALIERRGEEAVAARTRETELISRLDVWEGRANPWAIWPPDADDPPKPRQLASLLTARGDLLEKGAADPADQLESAQRAVALGILNESANREERAIAHLQAAITPLTELRDEGLRSTAAAEALADVYQRLSRLTASSDEAASAEWLKAARETYAELAAAFPADPLRQAERLDADLRVAAAAGFDSAAEELTDAAKAELRLAELWPTSVEEVYRVACELAGARPLLVDPSLESDAPAISGTSR